MEIRNKLYPYPVLSMDSDDYTGSEFSCRADIKKEGYNLKFTFDTILQNAELEDLIASKKAEFVYHLECAQTGFRTVVRTDCVHKEAAFSEDRICGRLNICPFIVACEEIPDYINSCFNEDYKGFRFQIEAGCVMAVGRQISCDIDKDRNDLVNTKSIFVITKNANPAATEMEIDIDQRKITIKLPEKDHANYKNMSKVPEIQQTLNALIIIPALIFTLSEVNKKDPEDRYTSYSSYNWYKSIKKAMAKRFNKDLDNDMFQGFEIVQLAQSLIKSPLSNALEYLAIGCANDFEGDDDE